MGAYLHLRGLAELDNISDSNLNEEISPSLSEPGSAASAVMSTGTLGALASNARTAENEDCSNFWAGQVEDVFEDLQGKTRSRVALMEKIGLNGAGQGDFPKNLIERGLDRREKGDPCSVKNEFTYNACVENRTADDLSFGDHGAPSASFRQRAAVASSSSVSHVEFRYVEDKGGTFFEGHIQGGLEEPSSTPSCRGSDEDLEEDQSDRLPDHLLIELLVRVPTQDWPAAACVRKRWAQLFKGDGLWHSALVKKWPGATSTKKWPGPIARGSSKRRYTALYVSDSLFARDKVEGVNEVAGHVYLFLKEQLESATPPVSYGLLHGTIIDQFLACCKTGDEAHNLASHIWIAVLDNLDETENTFHLLIRIAEEWEVRETENEGKDLYCGTRAANIEGLQVFPGYPHSKSHAVQWRLFERLFTDFRDCLSQYNYFDVLTRVRNKFEMIPQTWLGY